jgi:hypothetical protein
VLPFARPQITLLEPAVSRPKPARWPLWLWCNLLSFDAPAVAVLWQVLFARCFSVTLGGATIAVLALAVWLIYIADRMLDALHSSPELAPPARHAFCREHWNGMGIALLAGLFTLGGLCAHLTYGLLRNGIVLAVAVALYFGIVHMRPLTLRRFWPKEIVVGVLFCLGTCLGPWTATLPEVRQEMIFPALLFAALCVLNCVAIEFWEWNGCSSFWDDSPHVATIWMGRRAAPISLSIAVVAALALGICSPPRDPLFLALLLSSLALFALAKNPRRFTVPSCRVLADVALLTPLITLAIS